MSPTTRFSYDRGWGLRVPSRSMFLSLRLPAVAHPSPSDRVPGPESTELLPGTGRLRSPGSHPDLDLTPRNKISSRVLESLRRHDPDPWTWAKSRLRPYPPRLTGDLLTVDVESPGQDRGGAPTTGTCSLWCVRAGAQSVRQDHGLQRPRWLSGLKHRVHPPDEHLHRRVRGRGWTGTAEGDRWTGTHNHRRPTRV